MATGYLVSCIELQRKILVLLYNQKMFTARLTAHTNRFYNFGALIVCLILFWLISSQSVSAEVISSFNADIVVKDNGDLLITETIEYDFQEETKHGIVRTLNSKHAQSASAWYKEKYLVFSVESVRRGNVPEPYDVQPYDGLQLKIGNPNSTITGPQSYQIKYRVQGALSVHEKMTELYWNATGNEWLVDIAKAVVTVRHEGSSILPKGQSCYMGAIGADISCKIINEEQNVVSFVAENLKSGEGLTIAQPVDLQIIPVSFERIDWGLISVLVSCFWIVGLLTFVIRWRYKHYFTESIIAQYEPLPHFKPMLTGVLFDGRVDPRDISAGIVYLAQQGFISIQQTAPGSLLSLKKADYEVTLLRPLETVESSLDRALLELFFDDRDRLIAQNGGRPAILLSSIIRKRKEDVIFKINRIKVHLIGELLYLGLFKKGLWSGLATALVILCCTWVALLEDPAELILVDEHIGFYTTLITSMIMGWAATNKRTKEGYKALFYLQGFKLFLTVTEEDRYKLLNAPALSPELFMEFLPYAIALGVDKEWSAVFKNMQIENPSWFNHQSATRQFDTLAFTTSLHSFSSSMITRFRGSVGSFGRGFSGGGSGGGGGRSW